MQEAPLTQQYRAESPYGVPARSVTEFKPGPKTPLAPFEERQVKNLIQQVNAAPERVRLAFIAQFPSIFQ
jgi:hypothetical protein